jgi:hypothetical protein
MVYVQFTDFISDTGEVRRLARNVITADFTDDQIKSYQYKVYSIIRTATDKDDWATTDREFGGLQLIETIIAANLIKIHYGDGTGESNAAAQAEIDAAYKELEDIIQNLDTGTAESGSIVETDYKSWNLNELVDPPNRLSNVGISEVDF